MGRRLIRELTGKQSMDREKSWNTVMIRELCYIQCDAWSRTAPEIIPNPEMIPKLTPKWSPINFRNGMIS